MQDGSASARRIVECTWIALQDRYEFLGIGCANLGWVGNHYQWYLANDCDRCEVCSDIEWHRFQDAWKDCQIRGTQSQRTAIG
ncbi:hypothetical protein D3C71_1593040 [compost metagenome]